MKGTNFLKNLGFLFNEKEKVLNAFKGNIFPMKIMGDDAREKTSSTPSKILKRITTQGTGIKLRTHKQMLQSLPIALAQVKIGNASKNLLNKTRPTIYSLYHAKEITNAMNSIQLK